MKDAAQKTLHESAVFSYIYHLFRTGDILEMQPVVFMNWCDSNAEAWVLHSCCYLAHLTSLSHLGKEKPEEANARLWRASASSLALPRWAAWSYYSSANIALPWHCSSLWQGIRPFHQRTMPYSGKEGEESQESLS